MSQSPTIELLPYSGFAKLRLKQFLPLASIDETPNWQWMGGVWISEGIGFTSFCRLETSPEETGGLELDFRELSEESIRAIFGAIGLRMCPGQTFEELQRVFGPPKETWSFVEDRKSHSFEVGNKYPYVIETTVQEREGLIHVSVIRKDVLGKLQTGSS